MKISVIWQHILIILGLFLMSMAFHNPMLEGKVLAHADNLQSRGMRQELVEIYEETGHIGRWTTRNLSGMPSDLLFGVYPSNVAKHVITYLGKAVHPQAGQMLLVFIAFYMAMVLIGHRPAASVIASVSLGLSTHFIVLIDVGHTSKIQALAMVAPLLAGVWILYQGRKWVGACLIAVAFALQVAASHLQITYYTFLMVFIIMTFECWKSYFTSTIKHFFLKSLILSGALILGFLPNTSMIWSNYEYAKETIRGKSILQSSTSHTSSGLSTEYANVFSHGIDETLMLLVPGLKGGSGDEYLDENSNSYKTAKDTGLMQDKTSDDGIRVPLFWGDQPISGGPAYFGVIVLVLFLCSLILVKKSFRIMIMTMVIVTLIIAWGRNVGVLNDILFNILPFYNKFRAPSMVLGLTNVLMIWSVLEAVRSIQGDSKCWSDHKKKVFRTVAIVAGICLIIWVSGPYFYTYTWEYGRAQLGFSLDENLMAQLERSGNDKDAASLMYSAIKADRKDMLEADAIRSLFLILGLGALIWMYDKYHWKQLYLYPGLLALVIVDLWIIDRRYLNSNDFIPGEDMVAQFGITAADLSIQSNMRDNDRMVDLTRSVFQDARPAYHYRTIGGNHGAKLRRYQDLIDHHLNREIDALRQGKQPAIPALNMLNTRFIKYGPQSDQYFNNITSLGFAWFVNDIKWVDTAMEELSAISGLEGAQHAIVHSEFRPYFEDFEESDLLYGKIELMEYGPEKIRYMTHSSTEQFAVFSEIWYKGNDYWKVAIDGAPSNYIRANYLLRAMRIPAGSHEIIFEYHSTPMEVGEKISAVGSIMLIIFILFVPGKFFWDKKRTQSILHESTKGS